MALPPVFDACSIADGDKPVRQGQSRPSRRFGSGFPYPLSRWRAQRIHRRAQKTIAQIRVGGIAGEAAATLGLLVKVKRLRHRTHWQQGGSPLRGSQLLAPEDR